MVGSETHFFFMEIIKELQLLLDEYFEKSDYKMVDIIFRGEKGTKVLELFIDNKDGVNIDDLARINKELNEIIDTNIAVNDISKIVVSSPGTERPVKYLWQLYKHIGRTLEVRLNNDEFIEGKLISLSQDNESGSILIDIPHKERKKMTSELREINFSDIKELTVKISFSKK